MDYSKVNNQVQPLKSNGCQPIGPNVGPKGCQPLGPAGDGLKFSSLEKDVFVSSKPKQNQTLTFGAQVKQTTKNILKNFGL